MSKAKLDLRDIYTDIRKNRSRRKGLHIQEPQATIQVVETRQGIPYKQMGVCALIIFCCIFTIRTSFPSDTSVKKSVPKPLHLRRMIRMKCRTQKPITYCTTNQPAGDYVVSIGNCKDIFDFNGIPFTDVYKDKNGNYRVPNSIDHTLRIKKDCKDLAATVDTNEHSHQEYASNRPSNIFSSIQRIVWITDKCYKDFTVSVNNEFIYQETPSSMITSYPLETKVAYVYETDSDELKGSINIEGTGCDTPIYIYIK